MTPLIERMRQELVRRNYAATTIRSYLKAVEHFQQHISTPLDAIGPDDIRSYHAHLLGERKLAVNTVVLNVCALFCNAFSLLIISLLSLYHPSDLRSRVP